jgi:AcrR family transcriptional regulator
MERCSGYQGTKCEQQGESGEQSLGGRPGPHVRADAQRSIGALLKAAKEVFATSGVDAPVREIAAKAGVGVGTVYRHFPQRSELIAAVFSREIDACADAAALLAKHHEPVEALERWMQRYADLVATKRGLGAALHSGDPAFADLPARFEARLVPALHSLLEAASFAGEIRGDIGAQELLDAVARLSAGAQKAKLGAPRRLIGLLLDGLRCGAGSASSKAQDKGRGATVGFRR